MSDLDAVRDSPAVFAERVLRRPLWPHQAEAAASTAFITVIAKARRTGGTELVKSLAAWTCFRQRNVRAVILSAGQEASRRVTEELGAELAASKLTRESVADDFVTRIRLTNGSEILSLPASQRAVRGLGRGVKLLVVDEAGFVPDELWRAAHYVALDERGNGGRIVLVGTPWGSAEMFFRRHFEAGRDGDAEVTSFHWPYTVNPRLDHAYLERQRERVSPPEYAAEVLGEWSDATGALFPRSLLERATADVEVPLLAELQGPARPLAGSDWGPSYDRTALVLTYRTPVAALNPGQETRPTFVVLPTVWPAGASMNECAREMARCRAPVLYWATEVNGVGAGPSDELVRAIRLARERRVHRIVAVHTTNASKTTAYSGLLGLMEAGQIIIPRDPDLLRQLGGLRFERGERGFTRINAEDPVVHDDIADAASLAMVPYAPYGSTRLRCLAPKLAARFPTEADVPALEEPIVETGSGLRLYRRPVLQSVNGTAVTLPPGVATEDAALAEDWMRRARAAYEAVKAARKADEREEVL